MRPMTPGTIAAWVVIALLAFGPPLNLPAVELPWLPIGKPAPFKTDKLAVLIVEDSSSRTTALDATFDAVEASAVAGAGTFRRLDSKQRDLSMDEPWVQEAWAAKGPSVPWIVAANARTGINQAMPADKSAAVALVQALGGK